VCPEEVANVNELAQYNCKFINLEDIGKEKAAGNNISEIYRTDPNVNTRANIYQKSIAEIKHQPILGIGWGNISAILGTDERGTGLNASNIFLEVWLGAGLVGILSFVILLGYVFTRSAMMYLDRKIEDKTVATFILLGWIAIVIPNLFNSGIFLGFLWVYLAIAISLIEARE
jgi:O-antigen ligase